MCKIINLINEGPNLGYIPYTNYVCDKILIITIDDNKYQLQCWEDGKGWIKFPVLKTVEVEAGCIFRVTKIDMSPVYPVQFNGDKILALSNYSNV